MAPTFLVTGDIQAQILDEGLKNVFRWTWFDESLLYTDAKGNTQTANNSIVFKKCTKAGHVWCDICQSHMLYAIENQYGDLDGCNVADLGCGCGILSIGATMLGASHVVGFDLDDDALAISQENLDDYEIESVDLIQCDLNDPHLLDVTEWHNQFDTVIMNPPFGTKKNKGIDMRFLQLASKMATSAVYSLHKTSTREYVKTKATQFGLGCEVVAELRFDLPNTYRCHKQKSVDIEVDFIRFQCLKSDENEKKLQASSR